MVALGRGGVSYEQGTLAMLVVKGIPEEIPIFGCAESGTVRPHLAPRRPQRGVSSTIATVANTLESCVQHSCVWFGPETHVCVLDTKHLLLCPTQSHSVSNTVAYTTRRWNTPHNGSVEQGAVRVDLLPGQLQRVQRQRHKPVAPLKSFWGSGHVRNVGCSPSW